MKTKRSKKRAASREGHNNLGWNKKTLRGMEEDMRRKYNRAELEQNEKELRREDNLR